MKFIALHSRGGNYLVVASNVAWLRAAENGQTQIGIVGGTTTAGRRQHGRNRRAID